jgi:hypothetical protein
MGTEAFWVPAAITALGTMAGGVNQKQAANRQDAAQAQAIIDQQKIQSQATSAAGKTIQEIQDSSPNQLAAAATGEYVKQLRQNEAGASGPASALAPTAGGSSRYKSDVTAAQTGVNQFGDKYAGDLGKMDAAVRQRQNEGLDMQDIGTKLNTLGAQSYSTNFVDQLRASLAGTPNPYAALGANLLTNFGKNSGELFGKKVPGKVPAGSQGAGGAGLDSVPASIMESMNA